MLSILLFSTLLVASLTVTPSSAVDYTKVGVKVGDWAYYSVADNLTGVPMSININFTVTNIVQSNVTANMAFYYTNGTLVYSQTQWGNLSNGNYGTQGQGRFDVLWFLVVPNLTTGDMIVINGPSVNDTGIMVAGGLARSYAYFNSTVDGNSTAFRWDQATGIGTQGNITVGSGATTHFYFNWILNSTSLWSPPSYEVGVKVGDWAYYSIRQDIGGVDSGVRNANVTVTSIDRGNVTLTAKRFFANGTVDSILLWGNVSSGATNLGFVFTAFLVAANLGMNDPLFSTAPIWINGTTSLTVFGESRACNYAVFDGTHLYWDQTTGITTEANSTTSPGNYFRWNMTSTSLWSPAPTIDQPSAITYTVGSTGHSITWHPSSNVPCNYTITKNGTKVTSANWNGSSIAYNVDGLAVGAYAYTCTVNDTIGRRATSTVIVTVTPTPGLPISVIIVVGGIAVVIVFVAAVVVLRRRRT
jgi:plastocyanin